MGLGVALLDTFFAGDHLWAKLFKAVNWTGQVTKSRQVLCHSSDFSHKNCPVDLVGRVSGGIVRHHGIHREVVWTAPVLGFEPQFGWSEIPCHVLGNGSQQGFRSETSKSFSDGCWSMAVVPSSTL